MRDVLIPEEGWMTAEETIKFPPATDAVFKVMGRAARFMGRNEVPDIIKLLYIHKGLFWQWLHFASRLMPYGKLKRRYSEMIILRTAWLCRCRYEWVQHIEIGLRSGLNDEDIISISKGSKAYTDLKENVLLQAVEELVMKNFVSEEVMSKLKAYFSDKLIVEIILLTGHYQMLAGLMNTAGLKPEQSIESFMGEFNQRIESKV